MRKSFNEDATFFGVGQMFRAKPTTSDIKSMQMVSHVYFKTATKGTISGTYEDADGRWLLRGRMSYEGNSQYDISYELTYAGGRRDLMAVTQKHQLTAHFQLGCLVCNGNYQIFDAHKMRSANGQTNLALWTQYEGYEVITPTTQPD